VVDYPASRIRENVFLKLLKSIKFLSNYQNTKGDVFETQCTYNYNTGWPKQYATAKWSKTHIKACQWDHIYSPN